MIFSYLLNMQSHPSWVCGLKHHINLHLYMLLSVTPFVGVWIETQIFSGALWLGSVTPFVGVWIETRQWQELCLSFSCHTLRGCVD